LFEVGSRLFEVEDVAVYRQLVFTGVFRDGDDTRYTMAALAKGFDEKIDIYHGDEFTGCWFVEASGWEWDFGELESVYDFMRAGS
jgi:hypothetical protein